MCLQLNIRYIDSEQRLTKHFRINLKLKKLNLFYRYFAINQLTHTMIRKVNFFLSIMMGT